MQSELRKQPGDVQIEAELRKQPGDVQTEAELRKQPGDVQTEAELRKQPGVLWPEPITGRLAPHRLHYRLAFLNGPLGWKYLAFPKRTGFGYHCNSQV